MIIRRYDAVLDRVSADLFMGGQSDLTIGATLPNIEGIDGYRKLVSVEGTDGHVYTGVAIPEVIDRNRSKIILQFGFGDEQPTGPLDEMVEQHSFVLVS